MWCQILVRGGLQPVFQLVFPAQHTTCHCHTEEVVLATFESGGLRSWMRSDYELKQLSVIDVGSQKHWQAQSFDRGV